MLDSLHPKQRIIFDNPARIRVGVCGRRFGKTWLGAVECIATGLKGGRAWWIAPTYAISRIGWREILRKVQHIEGIKIVRGERMVVFPSGGEVAVRSAHNPDFLRGEGLDLAVLDEAPFIDEKVLPENIQPMLTERRGRILLIGTPYGRNWYYQEWQKGIEGVPGYASWQLPTSDNPIIPPESIEEQRRTTPDLIFRQEYLAEFLAYQGLIYPEFNRRIHTTTTLPETFTYYVAGVDWGYANPGVILIFGVDGDGRMTLVHEEYERQMHAEEWGNIAQQLQQQYRPVAWYCDPSEPDFISIFQSHTIPAQEAYNEVLPGIHSVKARMTVAGDGRPRMVISTECIHTAIEFESYMWMEHSKDGLRDKPRKANDHAMDAMRYAVMGVEQMSGAGEFEMNYFDTSPLRGAY